MEMQFVDMVFYLFATVLALSGLMVITARNPIHSVLFLILAFFNAAALFLIMGAEYIAMTLIIVYVGAVAVLMLFVVMMLNINLAKVREGFVRYLPVGVGFTLFIFFQIVVILSAGDKSPLFEKVEAVSGDIESEMSNTEAIGNLIYTNYALAFQVAGLILLVAMMGAIVLTHRKREGVKKQSISHQTSRRRKDAVALVKVNPGEGVKI